jgi:hypothetical protein
MFPHFVGSSAATFVGTCTNLRCFTHSSDPDPDLFIHPSPDGEGVCPGFRLRGGERAGHGWIWAAGQSYLVPERKLANSSKFKEGENFNRWNTLKYFEDLNLSLTQKLRKVFPVLPRHALLGALTDAAPLWLLKARILLMKHRRPFACASWKPGVLYRSSRAPKPKPRRRG